MSTITDIVWMALVCLAIYNIGRIQTNAIDWIFTKLFDLVMGKESK